MGTYTAKTRNIGKRPRSKRLRELGGTVVKQAVGGNSGTGTADVDLSVYEKVANKVTTIDAQSTDEQYPSAKAVKTALGTILNDNAWDLVPENTPYGSTGKAPTVAAIRHAFEYWIMRRSAITNEWHEKNDGGRGYGLLADSDFWDDVDMTNEEPMPGEDGYEMPGEANVPSLASVRWAFAVILQMIDGITAAAPNAHTHAVTDIVELQTILGGKAAASHTHAIADLTNAAALFTQFALNSGVVSLTIGGQQRSITLPTSATPSGDPMHYVYVKLGCSYNGQTGLWTYRDLDDLTTEQVQNAYVFTATDRNQLVKTALYRANVNVRFNFAPDSTPQENQSISADRMFQNNTTVEHIYFSPQEMAEVSLPNPIHTCAWATALKAVHNVIKRFGTAYVEQLASPTNAGNCFNRCPELVTLKIMGMKQTNGHIKFNHNKKMSLESIVFMVVNAENTNAVNIYLHTDALARCTADTTPYTYQGNTYTGIVALAAARNIILTDVLPT